MGPPDTQLTSTSEVSPIIYYTQHKTGLSFMSTFEMPVNLYNATWKFSISIHFLMHILSSKATALQFPLTHTHALVLFCLILWLDRKKQNCNASYPISFVEFQKFQVFFGWAHASSDTCGRVLNTSACFCNRQRAFYFSSPAEK